MGANGTSGVPTVQFVMPETVRDELVNRIVLELEARRTAPGEWVKTWLPIVILAGSIVASFVSLRTDVNSMKDSISALRRDLVPRAENERWQQDLARRLDDQGRRIDRLEDQLLYTIQSDRLSGQLAQHDEHSRQSFSSIEKKKK